MKATLIAAAFLIPTLVLAYDPASKDTSAQQGAMTPEKTLTKLHKLNQKGIEKATVAQSNGGEKVKSFARKQEKDFQKLDKAVMDLAKDKKITLSLAEEYGSMDSKAGHMGSEEPMPSTTTGSTGTDTRTGAVGSGTPGSTGSTTQTGTANDTRTGTATEIENDSRMGSAPAVPPTAKDSKEMAKDSTHQAMDDATARWDKIRGLKGAEFDTEYLSMTAEGARRNIALFEGWRVSGDRKLDKLIDQAVKVFKDHQEQAEKLQRDIRSS